MSDIADGVGTAVDGALTAHAVEPTSGRLPDNTDHAQNCSNCGAIVTGKYCEQCGQPTHVHRTLAAIGHDLMHGVLHLDGKLAHTLPLLAFKPGELTRRYIAGERAKFVSPMAMFLFSVFAMFAVFQILGIGVPSSFEGREDLAGAVDAAEEQMITERRDLEEELAEMSASDPDRQLVQAELRETVRALEAMEHVQKIELSDGIEMDVDLIGIEAIDKGLVKKWRDNPGLMLYKLQANGYKFSWLLIPLSLPFVWLLFAWRRGIMAYDHTIFVTYSLSFMSLLFLLLSLANAVGLSAGWVFAIFATVAPLHIYKHLKYSYNLSRFSTIWRMLALFFFILIVLLLFVQVLFLLGAL